MAGSHLIQALEALYKIAKEFVRTGRVPGRSPRTIPPR
jgi:hypothetical protein